MLSEANVVYDVIITRRQNHANDLVKNLDLKLYKAIAVVAGDGLLHEVRTVASRDWVYNSIKI